MDFGSLLHVAQANQHKVKKEPAKCYKTTFGPPQKEVKNKSLSANIQKFLVRKEEEERRKELEAKKKRDELLALRSQDNKAKKRVGAMLKRTKSANKSAIQDAIDDDNTAVTINGPAQPDEDDYGYVSQEASAYYLKMMEKYSNTPIEEPMYSKKVKVAHKDLNSTKDRVRMALQKEEEEEMMPHKRRRKTKLKDEDDTGDTTINYSGSDMRDFSSRDIIESEYREEYEQEKPPPKAKPRKPMPPPMDFHELLKLAEKKQFEPVKIEPKKKPEEEAERPMTKKQKIEYEKEQDWRRRKEEAAKTGRPMGPPMSIPKIPKSRSSEQKGSEDHRSMERSASQMKIPKLNNNRTEGVPGAPHQRPPRPNGNHLKESPYSSVPKPARADNPIKEERPPKAIASSGEQMQNRIQKVNSSSPSSQRMSEVSREKMKPTNFKPSSQSANSKPVNVNKNPNVPKKLNYPPGMPRAAPSGYDRKLQEAITAKLQETKKIAEIKKKPLQDMQSRQQIQTRPPLSKNVPPSRPPSTGIGNNRNFPEKAPSKPDQPSEQGRPYRPSEQGRPYRPSEQGRPYRPSEQGRPDRPSEQGRPDRPSEQGRPYRPSEQGRPQPSAQKPSVGKPPVQGGKVPSVPSAKPRPPPSSIEGRPSSSLPQSSASKMMPPPNSRPKQFPPPDVRPKQLPPATAQPKQFPPPDVRSRQFPPSDVRKKPKLPVKRRITDSEDEYDPEMDDFIEDGPEEDEDYSQHIREIFGYDRRKYSGVEDDDECMESNFAQQMKEEYRSRKIGLLEDLEDIRKEKEEKKRKLMKKQRLK